MLTFVHLSDIHFTKRSDTSLHDLDKVLRDNLLHDAVSNAADLGQVSGLLITGDIAYSGKEAEYTKAQQWIEHLNAELGCSDEHVWTVPGNHDVDRTVIESSKTTRILHERFRKLAVGEIDQELWDAAEDHPLAEALMSPLTNYNTFAMQYSCDITADKPFWEKPLVLPCGTRIVLRGGTSVLISDSDDQESNLILGSLQAQYENAAHTEFVFLCHHPLDWFRDKNRIVRPTESRARLQLYGHKHAPEVTHINGGLRLIAGATHPDRREPEWLPMYNLLQIGRVDEQRLRIRSYARQLNKTTLKFQPYPDPISGDLFSEAIWENAAPMRADTLRATSDVIVTIAPSNETPSNDNPAPTPVEVSREGDIVDNERRLTYLFMSLPFPDQIDILLELGLLEESDKLLANAKLLALAFSRAKSKGMLARLWEETAKRHGIDAVDNPFSSNQEGTEANHAS
ncbi:MAG TPA: metallophosphoesterase [bacterium]|jgi:predicted MPP superfamily phosphohydrolase